MMLLDSGGQYATGTTDVTRTFHLGTPTDWQRECFTRVLKGHIGLSSAVFPEGTPGPALDAFARAALWQARAHPRPRGPRPKRRERRVSRCRIYSRASVLLIDQVGLDYLHGTGHGVGAALNVHEGPMSISTKYFNTVGLKRGMVVSNEPGYYEEGQFGI